MDYQTATTEKKEHSADELDQLFREADECDKELFAEQRTNILLIAGEHYQRQGSSFFKRVRSNRDLSEQQKIRLTKNHTKRIIDEYVNNLLMMAPGVAVAPQNQTEIQDQKAAQIHQSVWRDGVDRLGVSEYVDDWADDFFGIGEVATKIFWDPSQGPIKAYEQKMAGQIPLFLDEQGNETPDPGIDPMTGQPTRQPAPGAPVRSGQFVFETIQGFNLLRDPCAKEMKKSSFLIYRKMTEAKELIRQFPDHKEKIEPSIDETVTVFDAAKGGYRKAEGEVMVREFYFRPCHQYPLGYFFITVQGHILAKGELPGGIFPIVFQPCSKIQTTPRGRGPVKQIRPYQAEINRMASKMAEHQITLGDDKLLLQNGSKLSQGVTHAGIRAYHYTGQKPEHLAGRTGEQYLNNMEAIIAELYAVMNVEDDRNEKGGDTDPFAMLFKAARQKKRFSRYLRRFENFLIEVCKTYLSLAKIHLPDDAVIYAAGRREQVNISEFRAMDDLCYQVKIEGQSEDIETKFGRQMVLNHTLQYVGNKLEKEDIGKILRAMPYGNVEESFSDLTMDYDSVTNELLALDRGELPQINESDNHVYAAKRLASRMRQADFQFLSPEIQQNYQTVKEQHMAMEAQNLAKIQRAQSGFIPTDGYLVSCDFYVPKPNDPTKTQRAKVPYTSLQWLIKQLEVQGQSLEQLEQMQQGMMAEMADMLQQQGLGGDGMSQGPAMGDEMPGGVANVGNGPGAGWLN